MSTAILEKKKAPHKLTVEDATNDDNSIVMMTAAKMDELKIFKGDTVNIKGKKRRDTVCLALVVDEADDLDNNKSETDGVTGWPSIRAEISVMWVPCRKNVDSVASGLGRNAILDRTRVRSGSS